MWRKRARPAPEELVVPDDISEARAVRSATRADLAELQQKAPLIERVTSVMINRQGKNHYIELLYSHVPREAS